MNEEEYLEKIKHEFAEYTSNTYWLNIIIDIIDDLKEVIAESKQLQNNWNELKKWLEECLNEIKQNDVYDRTSYEQGQIIALESSIAKAQELEQVRDENN